MDYAFEYCGKKFLVVHGHIFDNLESSVLVRSLYWINDKIVKYLKVNIQDGLRSLTSKRYTEGKYAKSLYESRSRLIKYFMSTEYDVIISGHTHYPELTTIMDKTIVNTGFWDNYTIINDDGSIEVHTIKEDT